MNFFIFKKLKKFRRCKNRYTKIISRGFFLRVTKRKQNYSTLTLPPDMVNKWDQVMCDVLFLDTHFLLLLLLFYKSAAIFGAEFDTTMVQFISKLIILFYGLCETHIQTHLTYRALVREFQTKQSETSWLYDCLP